MSPVGGEENRNGGNFLNYNCVKRVTASQLEGNYSNNLEYSDAQFNDFERERSKKSFRTGQIWAVYDTLDAMPRFYALIKNVVASEDFKVQITWLEPIPESEDEKKWLCQGLPASIGKFRLGDSETIVDHAIFSHLVFWKITKSGSLGNLYEIYPKKGETWALFKDWGFDDWITDQGRHRGCGFEVVEVLSDFNGEFGVKVGALSRIKGVFSGFRRKEGEDWEVIHGKNRFRFSHKIPSFAVTMLEGTNCVKNFFELDPASLPSNM